MEVGMSKRDTLQTIMNIGAGLAGAYFVGSAIAGAVKRKQQNTNSIQGVGKTFDAKFKYFVYALQAEMANGDIFIVNNIVFASSQDAYMYMNSHIRENLEIHYEHPLDQVDGYYEITEKATGKVVATIYIKSFYYYA